MYESANTFVQCSSCSALSHRAFPGVNGFVLATDNTREGN